MFGHFNQLTKCSCKYPFLQGQSDIRNSEDSVWKWGWIRDADTPEMCLQGLPRKHCWALYNWRNHSNAQVKRLADLFQHCQKSLLYSFTVFIDRLLLILFLQVGVPESERLHLQSLYTKDMEAGDNPASLLGKCRLSKVDSVIKHLSSSWNFLLLRYKDNCMYNLQNPR